ncbi:alpha/beta hydrolase [Nocardioides sp. WV_118_6]|uniref:alpha/beta fold hydrolase n=1 Tax=Nocardioides simplex TaxID=2045 RepID=UPI00214F65AB|nr:alpha/beta hydrolase [Pimelobacter simplex]UUW90377.1 alpha/beta hydrolase [Pimelobacter simplex]UUW94207.1 alpha/beta hydrolase [Pimelobacter simplex]
MSAAPGWSSRFVRLADGRRTHYLEAGEGTPVVLLHGGGPGAAARFSWPATIPALAERYRVLAPDLYGYGWSDRPKGADFSHEAHARQLRDFVDTLCGEAVGLVGNSAGAYVATKFALDNPDQVLGLFTLSSGTVAYAMGIANPDHLPARQALKAFDGTEAPLRAFLEGLLHTPPSDELVKARVKIAAEPAAMDAWRSMGAYQRRLATDPNLWQRFSLRGRLETATFPQHVLWGLDDKFAPISQARELAAMLPHAVYEELEDCGHQCQNDRPDAVNERILAFFDRVVAGGTVAAAP